MAASTTRGEISPPPDRGRPSAKRWVWAIDQTRSNELARGINPVVPRRHRSQLWGRPARCAHPPKPEWTCRPQRCLFHRPSRCLHAPIQTARGLSYPEDAHGLTCFLFLQWTRSRNRYTVHTIRGTADPSRRVHNASGGKENPEQIQVPSASQTIRTTTGARNSSRREPAVSGTESTERMIRGTRSRTGFSPEPVGPSSTARIRA